MTNDPADVTTSLVGRTALVVGASRGIGAQTARALAAAGARVALTARSADDLQGLADELRHGGTEVVAITADVLDPAAADRVVAEVAATLGDVDVLVYAAGQGAAARFEDIDDDVWSRLFDVNVLGAVRYSRAVLPRMRASGWGRIVYIASTAAKYGTRYQSPYNASKHAVLGLTKCLALETAGDGVTVNAVCPGFVDTDMVRDAVPQWAELLGVPEADVVPGLLTRVPIGRMLQPDEVARLTAYVASPAAGGITGQGLTLDGGLVLV